MAATNVKVTMRVIASDDDNYSPIELECSPDAYETTADAVIPIRLQVDTAAAYTFAYSSVLSAINQLIISVATSTTATDYVVLGWTTAGNNTAITGYRILQGKHAIITDIAPGFNITMQAVGNDIDIRGILIGTAKDS